MKTVFKYLFALCVLIGYNQLATEVSAKSKFSSITESQQVWGNLGDEISGIRQIVNSKTLLPTVVEISNLIVTKTGTEEENSTNLNLSPYFSVFFKSLDNAYYIYNSNLSSILKKHLTFSSCRKYLLFEVFRI